MRRGIKRISALAALCACALLGGCAGEHTGDPLAAFGADAELPHVSATATACPVCVTAAPTPAPTERADWAELPLDEADPTGPRPTRRIMPASLDAQASAFMSERISAERDNAGAPQANVNGRAQGCVLPGGEDADHMYFTAQDGKLYRERLMSGAPVSWETADAQLVCADSARNIIVSLKGDIVYICGDEIIQLTGGDGSKRSVLGEFESPDCLTRWDDAFMFVAGREGARGIYSMNSEGEAGLIVPGVRAMQIDAVNRRIVALGADGLSAYSLTGAPISPMIAGNIDAFCFSGAELYYSASDAVYRLTASGTVQRVLERKAQWLGCMDGKLYLIDGEGALMRAELDGSGLEQLCEEAYNPTLLPGRIACAAEPDGGLSMDWPTSGKK